MSKEEDTRRELVEQLKQAEETRSGAPPPPRYRAYPTRLDGTRFELAPSRDGIRERA
jgi:hypothetical protein